MDKRDYQLDNIKGIMIILVIFWHTITHLYMGGVTEPLMRYLYCAIYTFHMPVFIFIAGCFSKRIVDYDTYTRKAITTCLLPYLVFSIFYGMLAAAFNHKFANALNVLMPRWTMWFLLSLFFWKIMVEPFVKIRWPFIVSIFLSLYAGLFDSVGVFLALGKTFGFFPYFLAGYSFTSDSIGRVRKFNYKIIATIAFVFAMVIIGIAMSRNVAIGTFLMKESYVFLGQTFAEGVLLRSMSILLGFVCIYFFLCVIPNKKCMFSTFGMYSLTIYLAHSGVISVFERILKVKFNNPHYFIIFAFLFSLAVCFVFGNKRIHRLYRDGMEVITNFIMKKKEQVNE